jgi:DNA invertase Pin-like site-specific DNA recombinase
MKPNDKIKIKEATKAVAYCRTSSRTNIGQDRDSLKRQLEAITTFCEGNGYQLCEVFYDKAVSGADLITNRVEFNNLTQYCRDNGINTVIVEDASRFARDIFVQITGVQFLKDLNIQLIVASAPTYFVEESSTAVLIRNILGSLSQWDKSQIVHKLAVARARKRATNNGVCEGRKPLTVTHPEVVALARKLNGVRKRKPSLRAIAIELERAGYLNANGKRFTPKSVQSML